MIQKLLQHIQTLLETELKPQVNIQVNMGGVVPVNGTATGLEGASNPPPLANATLSNPTIALHLGKFELVRSLRPSYSTQPPYQPISETIPITVNTQSYPLQKTPLKDNIHCLVIDPKPILNLTEKDFTIDFSQPQITFQPSLDLSTIKTIQLNYSTPAIFKIQEFQQEFSLDVLASTSDHLEAATSLILAAILTFHDELINGFNQGISAQNLAKSEYSSTNLSTYHTLNHIEFLDGTPTGANPQAGWRLQFKAIGQFNFTRTTQKGDRPIKTIQIADPEFSISDEVPGSTP